MKNIVLVGFMGTGKSAVGWALAKRLKTSFLDLDRKIEKEAGQPIPKIFAEQGEEAFRALEMKAVKEVAGLKGHVIATGGGVMLRDENVRLLKECGTVICLTATPEVILQRTLVTLRSRPLLAGAEPRERVEELLKLRTPFYAKADWTVDTSEKTVQQVVKEILQRISV